MEKETKERGQGSQTQRAEGWKEKKRTKKKRGERGYKTP